MKAREILDRIDRRLLALDITERHASLLAKRPDMIRNIRKAVRADAPYDPRTGSIEALAQVLQTSPEWLLTGMGPEEIAHHDAAPEPLQGELPIRRRKAATEERNLIREIDIRAGMGGGGVPAAEMREIIGRSTYAADAIRGHWSFPDYFMATMGFEAKHIDIIECEGESMTPDLWPGDRCVIDRRRRGPSPDGVYAIWDGFGVVVKAIQLIPNSEPVSIQVISKNSDYSPYTRTLDEVAIIGKVVTVIRRL